MTDLPDRAALMALATESLRAHVLIGMLIEARRRGDSERCNDITCWVSKAMRPALLAGLAGIGAGVVAGQNRLDPDMFDDLSFHNGTPGDDPTASPSMQLLTMALHCDAPSFVGLAQTILVAGDETLGEVLGGMLTCAAGEANIMGVFSAGPQPSVPDTVEGLEP